MANVKIRSFMAQWKKLLSPRSEKENQPAL
jgi:hypothetical protein